MLSWPWARARLSGTLRRSLSRSKACSHAASIPTGPSLGIEEAQRPDGSLYEQTCSSGGSAGAVLRTPLVDAVVGWHGRYSSGTSWSDRYTTVTRCSRCTSRQPAGRLARPPAEFESFSLRRLWQARRFALVVWRLTLNDIHQIFTPRTHPSRRKPTLCPPAPTSRMHWPPPPFLGVPAVPYDRTHDDMCMCTCACACTCADVHTALHITDVCHVRLRYYKRSFSRPLSLSLFSLDFYHATYELYFTLPSPESAQHP